MAKLIYHVATTLDNFIADVNRDAGSSIFMDEGDHVTDFIHDTQQYDAVLMGGKTYEYGFQFGLKPGEPSPFPLKQYIFSSTMQFDSNDQVELIKNDATDFIRNLKNKEDGKLWLCGGGELAGSLIEHQLIDQLILKVNPIIIGDGIPLFGSSKPRLNLELVSLKYYSNGVVKPTYNIIYS
ncbi:dihydrofolate reductase family protein [Fictibacillus iocasae]|uniref:Dihydrofolate reductase family protein n=1 Tax=Fictibacillus iocasae TaxID=2715437 RepID=A0ABW2NT86_9BACL